MSVNTDPREIISKSPMSWLQIFAVAITIALNGLDGFDVLAISFASSGIAAEWGLGDAGLGIVLAMELIGMAIGSLTLGGVADKIGRRPTVLGCLAAMTVGMFMATTATGVVQLSIWRVLTGLGIGGMLASINAVAAEFSNAKRRHLSVSLMSIGYPIGAVIGGSIVVQLLQVYDWRSVFYLGTAFTVSLIPFVYFFMPESVHWLARKQPAGALEKTNRILERMGHSRVSALPTVAPDVRNRSVADIFSPGLIRTTLLLAIAYFCHITSFYFIVKWVPDILVGMGFTPSQGAGVLTWVNVGGATGGAVLGFLTLRYGLKALTIGVLVLSTVMVTIFGQSSADLSQITLICMAAGFCMNAAIVGLYAVFAHAFPTHVRATGTGFAIGVGRGGAVLAPIIAGFLFEAEVALSWVALLMSLGSVVAAGLLFMVKLRPDQAEGEDEAADEQAELPGTTPAAT